MRLLAAIRSDDEALRSPSSEVVLVRTGEPRKKRYLV